MKYTIGQLLTIVIFSVFFSLVCGIMIGSNIADTNSKEVVAHPPCPPNDNHDYQIDVDERYLMMYDGKRYVGRVRINWFSPLGKLLESDNY